MSEAQSRQQKRRTVWARLCEMKDENEEDGRDGEDEEDAKGWRRKWRLDKEARRVT